MTDFEDAFAARPARAMDIAGRGEVDQTAIGAVNEELNFPSLQKLRRVLVRKGHTVQQKEFGTFGKARSNSAGPSTGISL